MLEVCQAARPNGETRMMAGPPFPVSTRSHSETSTKAPAVGDRIYCRYKDHVHFHRSGPDVMAPQIRECWGILHYACREYVIVVWDRDTGPPSLKGRDGKASGLVILREEIQELRRLS